jgi:transposase
LYASVAGHKPLTGSNLGTASGGPVMRSITFTADDRQALAHDRYHHPDPRVQRKMEVLWLKSHGLPHDRIAAYADVSRRTVQRYLDEYLRGGLPRLRRCRWHHPQSVLVGHESSLEEHFRKHPPRSAKQARAIIEQQTGVRRGLTQVRHFLKDRLGLRWRKTGAIPVPPKETVEEHARTQAIFLQEKLEPRLKQARRCRRQVYFVDAAHFVFAPFLGCLWCVARLFVRAASGRKRYSVLGALDAVSHRMIRVTNEGYINAESVCALLRAVAGASVGLPITLVLDNARYQKCALVQSLAASLGIELLYLPGYSPNLNLIERLWRFVRKQSLDSTYYADFERFRSAIDGCLDNLPTAHKGEMETLLTHEFQTFENVPLLAA